MMTAPITNLRALGQPRIGGGQNRRLSMQLIEIVKK
jgi:hypothetical protein